MHDATSSYVFIYLFIYASLIAKLSLKIIQKTKFDLFDVELMFMYAIVPGNLIEIVDYSTCIIRLIQRINTRKSIKRNWDFLKSSTLPIIRDMRLRPTRS